MKHFIEGREVSNQFKVPLSSSARPLLDAGAADPELILHDAPAADFIERRAEKFARAAEQ